MNNKKPCELCEKLMLVIEKLTTVFAESIHLLQEAKQHDYPVNQEIKNVS